MSTAKTRKRSTVTAEQAKQPLTSRCVGRGPSGIAAFVVEDAKGRQVRNPATVIALFTSAEAQALVEETA